MSGGYRKYLLNILPRLASSGRIGSVLCVSPDSLRIDTWFEPMEKVEFVDYPVTGLLGSGSYENIKKRVGAFSPDVIYIPVARYFEFSGIPVVNMMQNIFPFMVHELSGVSFADRLRLGIQYLESRKALKCAKRVVATSKFVKDFLVEKVGLTAGKVSLIYFGRDTTIEDIRRPSCVPPGLEKKILFTAGSLEPYRGIEDIIGAAEYLKKELSGFKIVIAGQARGSSKNYYRRIARMIKARGLEQSVIWAGQLTQGELVWCYQSCAVFMITSRMETFGMVALEALSNGCLCVAARNPPFPEILHDCACYYTPKDPQSMAESIRKILSLDELKKMEAADKARKRADLFSWDKSAEALIDEFEKAI